MVLANHVDEVGNDDSAQVAQTQLPSNRLRGLQVGLENGVVKIARAHKTAGVHIHGGESLGLVDDQIAARLELHAATKRFGDFFINRKKVKNRSLALVVREFGGRRWHEFQAKGLQGLELFARVNSYVLGAVAHQVTQNPLQQVEVLM